MDFIKVGIVILAMILAVGISEYQSHKPVKLTSDILIKPQVVLKRLFLRDGMITLKVNKNGVTDSYGTNTPMQSEVKMVSRGVPRETNGSFKSYLPYHLITNKSSAQYKLSQTCWTDGLGFRKWGDYYCVALGSRYSTNIGDKFKITFDTGVEIYVILADCKSNSDTDKTNSYNTFNDNICEFLVDVNKLHPMAKRMGDVSYGNDELKGSIIKIEEIIE